MCHVYKKVKYISFEHLYFDMKGWCLNKSMYNTKPIRPIWQYKKAYNCHVNNKALDAVECKYMFYIQYKYTLFNEKWQ